MQNELEEVTEKLSEMIARPYLRTPKSVIIQTSALARRKRHEFVRAVAQGLIPPETPPLQRKGCKQKLVDGSKSEQSFSEASTWLRNCEWVDYDSDEETNSYASFSQNKSSPSRRNHQCSINCNWQNCKSRLNVLMFFNFYNNIENFISRV